MLNQRLYSMSDSKINIRNYNNQIKTPNGLFFKYIFMETDITKYNNVTPEIAKFYQLYYNKSKLINTDIDKVINSSEINDFIEGNKQILKSFINYMTIKNVLTYINLPFLTYPFTPQKLRILNSNINILFNEINKFPKPKKDILDSLYLENYITTYKFKEKLNRNYNSNSNLDHKHLLRKLLINYKLFTLLKNNHNTIYKERSNITEINNNKIKSYENIDFDYLILLLKCYILDEFNYNKNDHLERRVSKILTSFDNILFIIGFYNLDKILIMNKLI